MKAGYLFVMATVAATVVCVGCDEHAPLRGNENAVNAELAKERDEEVQPAIGKYVGPMHMTGTDISDNTPIDVSYEAVLEITTLTDTKTSTDSTQPTETVSVPHLTANLSFTELRGKTEEELFDKKYNILLNPMGRQQTISFDLANFTPSAKVIDLPYSVSVYPQGPFGALRGKRKGNTFVGSWYCKPLGRVGTFNLVRQ